jgi:mitosis inhibitor protein kinase SWE1
MMRSGLETPSPQTSPLNDGPGTVYSDDEDMLFDGPPETSFVFSVTEDTPSPRSHKAEEGRFPSKYKQRDSGIVLSDDESIRVRNSALSTSSSSMYSDNDNTDDLITPGIMPGAQSGWPRISGLDDLHSFTQSHLHQYFGHDEDDVDAFILRTLEACGKPSATESKKPPGTPVKKLKGHFGLDGGRPWQSAVASKIGFSFDGADGVKADKKKPRKSLPAAFPPPLGRGSAGADKGGGSDTEEDEDATSPSSRKQYKGLGLGRPAGRWLMRRSSSGAFSSGESAGGTPTRRNVNFKGASNCAFVVTTCHLILFCRLADACCAHINCGLY